MGNNEVKATELEQQAIELGQKWSKVRFLTGLLKKIFNIIFCKEFLAFATFTFLMWHLIQNDKFDFKYWLVYGVVAVVFIFQEAIAILLSQKTNLDIKATVGAEAKVGVSGDLNKAASDIASKANK
jgi:hypothetical protein